MPFCSFANDSERIKAFDVVPSLDGFILQAYMHGEGRCLHEWEPHNGEPVTLLFFLDNYTNFENE